MKVFNIVLLALFVIGIIITSHYLGVQSYHWLPTPAALEALPVGDLFSFLVSLGSLVFLGVLGMMIYSILFFRAAKGDKSDAYPIKGNVQLEIIWTVIPIVLVVWITYYSYNIYQKMNVLGNLPVVHLHNPLEESAYAAINDQDQNGETIEVTARQWDWSFHYPNGNITSRELHLPLNQKVRLILKSEDVIHGFFVPNFRIKQDIVPNRAIELRLTANRVGKYQLEDSQFSGTYFALMQADVYVDPVETYSKWLSQASKQKPLPESNQAILEHNRYIATPSYFFHWPSVSPAKSLVN